MISVGDDVMVAMAQDRRALPQSDVRWYRAKAKRIDARANLTIYHCWVEFHTDTSRLVVVSNNRPSEVNDDYDAIKSLNDANTCAAKRNG